MAAPHRAAAVEYTLGWLADHAEDLDADPTRLVVLGVGPAAEAAAAAARAARDNAWPPLVRQLIVLPEDTAAHPAVPGAEGWASPRSLSGLCGATVILDQAAARASPYVRALVLAGVPVRQRRLAASSDTIPNAGVVAAIVATELADLPGQDRRIRRPTWTFSGGPLVRIPQPDERKRHVLRHLRRRNPD